VRAAADTFTPTSSVTFARSGHQDGSGSKTQGDTSARRMRQH